MPKRSSKRPRDVNQLAKYIVDLATRQAEEPEEQEKTEAQKAAALLGRRGGLKGGKARAKKLSAKQRKTIARKAAKKRWAKPR